MTETAEDLDDQLLEALAHLYDPDYHPPAAVFALTGRDLSDGPLPVQSVLIRAVEALAPQDDPPVDTHLSRVYDVINRRFVLKLTQEKTAELMDISVRHLNRIQREAVHTLAQMLWERKQDLEQHPGTITGSPLHDNGASTYQAPNWQAQARRELASLQASAPGAISDVDQAIQGVLELHNTLPNPGTGARIGFVQPHLLAAIHPSALRQMLITAIGRLARYQQSEPITVFARLEGGNVRITLAGASGVDRRAIYEDLVRDILTPESVSVDIATEGGYSSISIRMPSAGGKITVLAVDDNADMVHFYRRCTTGTRYQLVSLTNSEGLIAAAKEIRPDIILLDVMLPKVDGWTLLMHLHEDQATRPIPVIICTVVREEELALSLGAAGFLAKPIRPRELIQALDQVLTRKQAGAQTIPAST